MSGAQHGWAISERVGRVVNATDPLIMTAVVVLVLCVALLAAYIPARRAAGADPMVTLRTE